MREKDVILVLTSQDCVNRPQPVPEHRIPSGWQGQLFTVILGNWLSSRHNEDYRNLGVGNFFLPHFYLEDNDMMYQGKIQNRIYRTRPLLPESFLVFFKGMYVGMVSLMIGLTVLIALTF